MKFFSVSFTVFMMFCLHSSVIAGVPEPVCFYKGHKCCYTFGACGYETKKIEKKVDCPYNKCENVCKNECVPERKCTYTKVEVEQDCKQVPDGYSFKHVCTPKYETKEYCYNEQKCEEKCYPHCYNVAAYCTKYYYYKYPKYCPTHYCEKPAVIEGSDITPSIYVAPEGTQTKVEDGQRYDK